MNDLYHILSIFATGLLFTGGLMLLFTVVPDSPLLGNYRKARYALAGAYLFFFAVKTVEYVFGGLPGQNVAFLQTVTLVIAASQALLFTFAMLALLEVHFPGWRHIFREAAYVLLFIAVVFAAYVFCSAETLKVAFYVFVALYALLLARYTMAFFRDYRRFRLRVDNYFSDLEAGRLRWVAFSFFAALAIGVMALLSSLFMSTLVALLFAVVFDMFYIYFAIRFINYAHQFQSIERAMDGETPAIAVETHNYASLPATNNEITKMQADAFALLEKRIGEWIARKGFTEKGITIDTLAAQLVTNSKYLSVYINTRKKQTFREWINALRIEEAKTLLRRNPKMTVHEIAARTGFSTESHFGQQFRACTGFSPSSWRKQAKCSTD